MVFNTVNYVVIISVFVLILLDLPEPTICLEIDGECLTSTIYRENQTTIDRVICSVNGEYRSRLILNTCERLRIM